MGVRGAWHSWWSNGKTRNIKWVLLKRDGARVQLVALAARALGTGGLGIVRPRPEVGGPALGLERTAVAFRHETMLQQEGHKLENLGQIVLEIADRELVVFLEAITLLQIHITSLLKRDVLVRQNEHEVARGINVVVHNGLVGRHNSRLVWRKYFKGLYIPA